MLRLIPFLALLVALPASAQSYYTECARNTGSDATLVFPADAHPLFDGIPLQPGDEVAAFTSDGLCAGVVVWPEGAGSVAMTLWGDNPATEVVDGFLPNELLTFRAWSSSGVEAAPPFGEIEVAYRSCDGLPPICRSHGQFEAGTLVLIDDFAAQGGGATDVEPAAEGVALQLDAPYPNPVGHTAYLRITLDEAQPLTIVVLDARGRTVRAAASGSFAAEPHVFELDVRGLPAGVYFVQVRGSRETVHRPLTVIR